ncbi:hypothetical protein RG66_14950 [Escherichia coli]|uniref:ead/Ea22-like family protein n=1 Tax=Escherichia coli TaxID=562 RepID=UPI00092DC936|nr:ead/Ea22-like family protein [Escherichia coli]APL52713.1 hypothetical protein RG66_14950 [Escherichia coli]
MSKIDYQALREAAEAIKIAATPQKLLAFRMKVTPQVVLALLDERESKDKAWSAQDNHINQQADRIELLEKKNGELGRTLETAEKRIAELEANLVALAAENAAMHETIEAVRSVADNSSGIAGWHLNGDIATWEEILPEINDIETQATDAFLAKIRAEARNEGINYTASRLAAAFNHGFINKSLREVFDVTRMILSAKEELANEPHPIDGLSGEYAEKSLEEWAEQIRSPE